MTLFLRTIQCMFLAMFRPRPKSITEKSVYTFRVMPTDLDQNMHMNNARYLNYCEATRHGYEVQTGFLKLALKKKLMVPIKRIDIEFLRPLKLFQKFSISMQIASASGTDMVLYQKVESNGKLVARAAIYCVVKRGRESVPVEQIFEPLGYDAAHIAVSEEVTAWLKRRA